MKIKKNKKGLTLIEIIVAMAVFAIMSLLVATMFATAMKLNLRTNNMNKQMQTEGATAEKKTSSHSRLAPVNGSGEIEFNLNDGTSFKIKVDGYDANNTGDYAHFKYFVPRP